MARILLVDDEELVRRVVKVVLEAEGHDVLEASDGTSGRSTVSAKKPDVVVLDLMMPGEDGIQTCRAIKSMDAAPRVLVLTSVPGQEAEAECTDAGADDFLAKPFSPLELLSRVSVLAEA